MMPSTDVSHLHTLFADTQWATAATKSPRADGEAVPPCCYRVLAAASVMGCLLPRTSENCQNANFAKTEFSEVHFAWGYATHTARYLADRPNSGYRGGLVSPTDVVGNI